MQFKAAIRGNLRKTLRRREIVLARGVKAGVRATAMKTRTRLRQATRAAGLRKRPGAAKGQNIAKTWQALVFPKKGSSLGSAAVIFSKAPHIMQPLIDGAVIRARKGRFLTIPLPAAVKLGFDRSFKRSTGRIVKRSNVPAAIDRFGRLDFVPLKGREGALLVVPGKKARAAGLKVRRSRAGVRFAADFVPLFLLIPQVRIRQKIPFDRIAREALRALPDAITAEIERRQAREAAR